MLFERGHFLVLYRSIAAPSERAVRIETTGMFTAEYYIYCIKQIIQLILEGD